MRHENRAAREKSSARRPGQRFRGCGQLGDAVVRLIVPPELSPLSELVILSFGDPPGIGGTDRSTILQNRAAELAELLIEKSFRILHDDEPSEVQLVFEDIEEDRRQPIQFP